MFHKIIYSLIIVTIALTAPVFLNNAWAADQANVITEDNPEDIFSSFPIIKDAYLDEMRGAALDAEVLGVAIFDAISLNNSTSGTFSGGNIIDNGAFSDSAGLSTIIQNSGNNVLIQSATILNLNID